MKTKKEFFVHEPVWAKLRGYPPWPARIEDIEEVNRSVLYKVVYFGTHDFTLMKPTDIYKFAENKSRFERRSKTVDFLKAVGEVKEYIKDVLEEDIVEAYEKQIAQSTLVDYLISKGFDPSPELALETLNGDLQIEHGSFSVVRRRRSKQPEKTLKRENEIESSMEESLPKKRRKYKKKET